jgi:hypothetical protein
MSKYRIILDRPALEKCRLIWINNFMKQRLKPVSQDLGNNLIRKVSKIDRSKLGHLKRIIYLGNKG